MAVLPNMNSLGDLPSGLSGRVHPNYDAVVAPGRGHAEGYERVAEGYRELGRGISKFGAGVENYAERVEKEQAAAQERQNKLAAAQADSRFITDKLALDNELSHTTDYQEASKFGDRYNEALNNSAQYIQDPIARAVYLEKHTNTLIYSNDRVADRSNQIYKNNYMVGLNETMDGLAASGRNTQDPAERNLVIKHAGEFMDEAARQGIITPEDAYKRKEQFTDKFAWQSLDPLSPEQKLRAVRPVTFDAAANQAMSFFISKGWTPAQAAGIVGNLAHESGGKFATNARNHGDGRDGSDSIGIGQWNSTRAKNLLAFAEKNGKHWTDFQTQLEFVQYELETSESAAAQRLRRSGDAVSSTEAFLSWERPQGWEGGISTAHGGHNRLNYAKQFLSHHANNGAAEDDNQKMASLLSPEKQDRLYKDAIRGLEKEDQDKGEQHRQFVSGVKAQIQNDISSIHSSGQELNDLTPDMVERALGSQAREQFELQREFGKDYYTATRDWNSLPMAQIRQRLDSLNPGETPSNDLSAKMRANYYKEAIAKAKDISKKREEDPAAAVDEIPSVKAAKENVELGGGDDAVRALANERMKAMDAIGIPAERRVPVTRQEAQTIMAPVLNALPGQEKAALQSVVPKIVKSYGQDMAEKVIGYSLNQARIDAETQKTAARVFKKIGLGQKVSDNEINNLGVNQTNDAMGKAANASSADTASAPQKSYPMPSDSAIQALVGQPTPDRVQQFEQLFGPGSAKRILGAATAQNSKGGE